jgi:hypothetical protein
VIGDFSWFAWVAENHQLWLKSADLFDFIRLPGKSEFFHIENTRVIPAQSIYGGMAGAFSFAEAFTRTRNDLWQRGGL